MADCPTCEYHKQRAQIWRDEVYRLTGHPLPERKKEWTDLHTTTILDIYQEVLKEWRGGHQVNGQIAFAEAIQTKLKEKNT